jgi:hypothetical protein
VKRPCDREDHGELVGQKGDQHGQMMGARRVARPDRCREELWLSSKCRSGVTQQLQGSG